MSAPLVCPKGHRWKTDSDEFASNPGRNSACPECGSAPVHEASTAVPGNVGKLPEIFGRYRIIKQLGEGGMGAVYLAQDTQLDRHVALKVPHISAADRPVVMERFNREAKVAGTIVHPNICPVYDVGEVDGIAYLSMAFIE